MRTDTWKYEAVHGSKPRGRGTWAFEVHYDDGTTSEEWASHSQTFSEARREVLARCAEYRKAGNATRVAYLSVLS